MASKAARGQWGFAAAGLCALTFFGYWLLLIVESVGWLRYGEWPDYKLQTVLGSLGIPPPVTQWGGIQKIFDYFLRNDVSFSILLAIGIFGFIAWLAFQE